jgi:hypothetical protein
MIGKGAFIASKAFVKKHYTGAVKAVKDLRGPATKYGSKVTKHIKKHPIKYTAGATALASFGVYSEHQKQKKMGTHKRLKKELKKKGYI